jgi:Zn-finger nucleic acid-binding protein
MSSPTALTALPYVCPACGYPMREADVHSGLIDRCPTCDAGLAAPADDPTLRETVRLSRAELAALWTG